jgi:hypothetical protein
MCRLGGLPPARHGTRVEIRNSLELDLVGKFVIAGVTYADGERMADGA